MCGSSYMSSIIYDIMGWDETYSYKLRATIKEKGDERVLYFDLDNYIGRAMGKNTEETITGTRPEAPKASEETKGFFYAPDENEPQDIEEIRDMEERWQRLKEAELRTFGEPAFQYFFDEAEVLPGEGSLMAEAKPIAEPPSIDPDETEALLKQIQTEPPVYHYGKSIITSMNEDGGKGHD